VTTEYHVSKGDDPNHDGLPLLDKEPVVICFVPKCRHGCEEAFTLVALQRGCIAFPNDYWQWLCFQHLHSLPDGQYGSAVIAMKLGWGNG
jgi:hypothetical protein